MRLAIQSGAVIPVLLMLPNVAWMLFPVPDDAHRPPVPAALGIAENVGRGAVLILPFFYSLNLLRQFSMLALAAMTLALAVYYVAWGRYFANGRSEAFLSARLVGIPSPLALAPIALFALSSYLMGSWLMLGASLYFGVLHLWVSSVSHGAEQRTPAAKSSGA